MNNTTKALTGKGIGVAVLDTGIFPHVDFGNQIIAFRDFVQHKTKPYDDNGHGTHVAGIIAGSGKASQERYCGVAPGCGIIALKVLDKNGNGQRKVVLKALKWVLANREAYNIRIVNISVGTTTQNPRQHQELIAGVEEVWDAGIVVVTAAGNQGPSPGTITAPGSSKKVITVGSSDMLTGGNFVSSIGPTRECICKPDIVTPGNQIISCAPDSGQGAYTKKSGTSMSTPRISGAVALLLEKDPLLSNVEVKMLLRESARDMGFARNQQGWGEFDMNAFLSY